MMYRVLIVDDEEMIVEGLKILLEKGLYDCEVSAVAYDGTEGYQTAMEIRPDIILTDVRMYEMDGIEMIRRLKADGLETRYIVLSGYAEFEYAKQAILLGVEDYITKPVEEEELYLTFRKVCQSIGKERQEHSRIRQMQERIGQYSQSMKEYYLRDILEGKACGQEIQSMDFLLNQSFLCAVFEYGSEDLKKAEEILYRKSHDLLETQYSVEILKGSGENQWIVLLGAARQGDLRKVKVLLGRIRFDMQQMAGGSVCCGFGVWHKRREGIRKSYEEALCALNYKVIYGLECLVNYGEIRDLSPGSTQISEEEIQELEACINAMDNEGCRKAVEKIFRRIGTDHSLSPERLRVLSLNLILSGIRKMPFMQLQLNEYLGKNILSLESLAKFKTMEQLQNWIINVLCGMNELMLKQNLPEKRDVVKEVQEYINRNFGQNITLTEISEKFYINPYYFSQLFKKKTGETYQSYLTSVRIGRAKKLLEETDLKIYEICEIIGYSDVNYFSQVFEKREGTKPSNYRKSIH